MVRQGVLLSLTWEDHPGSWQSRALPATTRRPPLSWSSDFLALASAVATNLAFLFKHRGAVLAPPIEVRHLLRSAVGLFRSTSVAANLAAIIGGILVFHEPIGSGPLEIGARFVAFCLVIAGAALMPAPMRATPDAARATNRQLERATPR
jgi:hypothetical protein